MKHLTVLLLTIAFCASAQAQEQQEKVQPVKYADRDNDGMNDLFRDADGNGVNDVNGEKYLHRFPFVDEDGDGKNDVFLDENGDGINDRMIPDLRNDGKLRYAVIDCDGDGINDITGEEYVRDERAMPFRDEDGDGINDIRQDSGMKHLGQQMGQHDKFIDRDGDGINDGRAFSRGMRMHGIGDDTSSGGGMHGHMGDRGFRGKNRGDK